MPQCLVYAPLHAETVLSWIDIGLCRAYSPCRLGAVQHLEHPTGLGVAVQLLGHCRASNTAASMPGRSGAALESFAELARVAARVVEGCRLSIACQKS